MNVITLIAVEDGDNDDLIYVNNILTADDYFVNFESAVWTATQIDPTVIIKYYTTTRDQIRNTASGDDGWNGPPHLLPDGWVNGIAVESVWTGGRGMMG